MEKEVESEIEKMELLYNIIVSIEPQARFRCLNWLVERTKADVQALTNNQNRTLPTTSKPN